MVLHCKFKPHGLLGRKVRSLENITDINHPDKHQVLAATSLKEQILDQTGGAGKMLQFGGRNLFVNQTGEVLFTEYLVKTKVSASV
ncbi:MAG: hypothetical protein NC930_09095 [Candidatus Omnitrophica bacterium]|nr:hypothetical protein [Candidatus Omnitrophota bacterium]